MLKNKKYYNLVKKQLEKDKILEKYKNLGGKTITLGSDSHFPDTISYKIDDGIKHLKEIGFDHISYFENKDEKIIEI